jgi:hypothetical protein
MRTWIALAVLTLTACSGGPYSELESKFASVNVADGPPIPTTTLVLVGKKHRGAFNYKKTMAIRLLANAVEIEPAGPLAFTMKTVRIPREAIGFCSQTCFGPERWDADLLLPDTGIEIGIPESREVMNWCWEQRLPIASGQARRDWMYNGKPLPERSMLDRQFSSRAAFDAAARRSCLGY